MLTCILSTIIMLSVGTVGIVIGIFYFLGSSIIINTFMYAYSAYCNLKYIILY